MGSAGDYWAFASFIRLAMLIHPPNKVIFRGTEKTCTTSVVLFAPANPIHESSPY